MYPDFDLPKLDELGDPDGKKRICGQCARLLHEVLFVTTEGLDSVVCRSCSMKPGGPRCCTFCDIFKGSSYFRRRNDRVCSLCTDLQKEEQADTAQARLEARFRSPAYRMWLGAKYRAKTLGLAFDIAEDDIVIPATCPILGHRLTVQDGDPMNTTMSLDRIVPEKGYVKGNVQVISLEANRKKNNLTIDEAVSVVENLKKAEVS